MKRLKLCTAGIAVALSVSMTVPAWAGAVGTGIDLTNTESSMVGPTVGDIASGANAEDTTNTAEEESTDTTVNGLLTVSEKWAARDVAYLTDEETEALRTYFQGSVIIGDSIAENFQRYNMTTGAGDVVSDNFSSLAVAGYSISKALLPNDGKNIHPMIQGNRYRLPEAVGLLGARHVFSFFGYKDLADVQAADKYEMMLKEIEAANPETDITVISTTYMVQDYQNSQYNNAGVRFLNEAMKLKCQANGWGYIDVQDIMSDGNGNLPAEWSIDKQIHYNYQYYIYWINEMKRYALTRLGM